MVLNARLGRHRSLGKAPWVLRISLGLLWAGLWIVSFGASAAEHPDARNTMIDGNPYWLDPSGISPLSTETARLLPHLQFRTALTLHDVHRSLGVIDIEDGTWLRSLVENRQQLNLAASLGLFRRFEVGFILPIIAHQQGEFPGQKLGNVASAGVGDMVIHLKGQILSPEDYPVGLAISAPLSMPTGNSQAYMGRGNISAEPRVTVSQSVGPVHLSTTWGILVQPRTTLFGVVDDDKLTWRVGAYYEDGKRSWAVGTEFVGGGLLAAPFKNPQETQAEWNMGARYRVHPLVMLHGGFGLGLTRGLGTPLVRAFLGTTFGVSLDPDSDGDGIPRKRDQCPLEPEDLDGFEDEDGCPDVDNDGDGVLDVDDGCPMEPEDLDGYMDTDGCPEWDNDGDGLEDSVDKCPADPEDLDGFEDEDGCPDLDNDEDGVLDEDDRCPSVPEDVDGFNDEDGCPDPDNDGDGILDGDDACPDLAEDFNGVEDEDGCPDSKLAYKTRSEIVITQEIHFVTGMATPAMRRDPVLLKVLEIMQENPTIFVRVEGHTDSIGGDAFNLHLSRARAQAVRDQMVRMSNPEDKLEERLEAVGLGEEAPVEPNRTFKGKARNRRVQFIILE